MYEKSFKERMDQYKSKTSRQKYAKSEPYAKFKQAIHVGVTLGSQNFQNSDIVFRRFEILKVRCHRWWT